MADYSFETLNATTADKKSERANRKLKIGIIGTGWIAGPHIDNYKKMSDVEIVALADLVPGKAEQFAKDHNITTAKYYNSDVELIKDWKGKLDAVSICTYNAQHAPCAIHALEAGINVLLEKPFTVTLEEAIEVMKIEKKSGKILSIGFQPRFDANMKLVKKIVQSGELGKVYYIQTGGGRRRGIPTPFGTSFIEKETAGLGALADIGCYSIDMCLNALGYPKPLTASGYISNYFGKNPKFFTDDGRPAEYADLFGVDDFGAGFVRLEGGVILDFRIAWAMHLDTSGDTIIMGTEGSLRIPSTQDWNGSVGGPMTIYHDIAGRGVETIVKNISDGGDCFYRKIRSFLDAIKTGGVAPVPSSEIIYNQAIIDGIAKSSRLGKEIEIVIPKI